jgi:hypothetical protein
MPLCALKKQEPSMNYYNNSFGAQWARSLDSTVFGASTAICVDDTVVVGLFSSITCKKPTRQFFPALKKPQELCLIILG